MASRCQSARIDGMSEDSHMNGPHDSAEPNRFDPVEVDLKNNKLAAVLAWLWPGAGHLYQGRYGKSMLFMVCILGTYFWGLAMGDGHVVYASWRPGDMRLYYAAQVHVGLPALAAIPQSYTVANGNDPMLNGWMAPPRTPIDEGVHDEKASWHEELGFLFEMGTLFTTVAGLLNLFAVYDAYAGPAFASPQSSSGAPPPGADGKPVAMVDNLTSGFGFLGGAIGLVIALTLRGGIDMDKDMLGYLFAIAGIGIGWAIGRGLRWTICRTFGVTPSSPETTA